MIESVLKNMTCNFFKMMLLFHEIYKENNPLGLNSLSLIQ